MLTKVLSVRKPYQPTRQLWREPGKWISRIITKDAILLTIDQWCTQCRLVNHSYPTLVKNMNDKCGILTSRPIVVWKECICGVIACRDICSWRFAVGTTFSSCLIVSMRAVRASARLVSIGVSRILVSYDRTRGGGLNMQAMSNTKWSRAWRKCLPVKGRSEAVTLDLMIYEYQW